MLLIYNLFQQAFQPSPGLFYPFAVWQRIGSERLQVTLLFVIIDGAMETERAGLGIIDETG